MARRSDALRAAIRVRQRITAAEKRLAQAEFIRWPALAESFRRELTSLRAKLQAQDTAEAK